MKKQTTPKSLEPRYVGQDHDKPAINQNGMRELPAFPLGYDKNKKPKK